jgi:hypothetical protein
MSGSTTASASAFGAGSGAGGLGSAEIVAALSAVIRAVELPAVAELRLALERKSMAAEDTAASAQRNPSIAAQVAALRYQALMRDARALADQAVDAGLQGLLVENYATAVEECWGCGRIVPVAHLEQATPSVLACRRCMEQLRARGWRASGGVCGCGVDIGMGSVGGRRRCMHCALRFVRRRRA